jgi:hypothetical protein
MLISRGPRDDLWYATEEGAIGPIAPNGEEFGDPGCPLKDCAPIEALAEGPVKHGPLKAAGPELKVLLECRGGAAGQRCKGTYELFLGKFAAPRGHFAIPTMTHRKATLTSSTGATGARRASLASEAITSCGSRVSPFLSTWRTADAGDALLSCCESRPERAALFTR